MIALLAAIAVSVVLVVTIMRQEIDGRLRNVIVEMDAKRTKDFEHETERHACIQARIDRLAEDTAKEITSLADALGYERYITLAGPLRTGYMKKTIVGEPESRPYPN